MLGHELRNPIGAISNSIRVLTNGELARERTDALHDIVARQTRTLTRLVDDLLDVSRLTSGKIALKREAVNLAEIAERCLVSLRAAQRVNLHEVALDTAPVWVDGDPTRLEQVLANLLENALKYTAAGGLISLRVAAHKGSAVVSVRDTGRGIEPEMISRIFDVFTQGPQSLDRAQGGLGIGLTLVKRLVELHGGEVEAKSSGQRIWTLLGRPAPRSCTTAFTISLGTPEAMASATAKAAHRPLLKIKLGGDGDDERISAVRKAAPESELIVDANEAWTPDNLEYNLAACANAGVTLVEQPLPAGQDEALARIKRPIAVCADESVHDRASLEGLRARYDAVNIKLDKTGGLTEALAMADAAHALGFEIMIGCMVATSLAMAPAMLLAQQARFVDLDGPLLLARDRDGGLRYDGSLVYPPDAALWG